MTAAVAAAAAALSSQIPQQGEEALPFGSAGQRIQRSMTAEITAFTAVAVRSGRSCGRRLVPVGRRFQRRLQNKET